MGGGMTRRPFDLDPTVRPGSDDCGESSGYSTALTMSSTTFFASPNTIIVLSM
jgi:hypothetical protein